MSRKLNEFQLLQFIISYQAGAKTPGRSASAPVAHDASQPEICQPRQIMLTTFQTECFLVYHQVPSATSLCHKLFIRGSRGLVSSSSAFPEGRFPANKEINELGSRSIGRIHELFPALWIKTQRRESRWHPTMLTKVISERKSWPE
jgi:hypothetical protein